MFNMKDSGVKWIGYIPQDWYICKTKYKFKYQRRLAGERCDDYNRLALTMKGVVMRSKEDNSGIQPSRFETYQILKEGELVFKLIDLQNVTTSRVGRSPYEGLVSPAYIILKDTGDVHPRFAEKYFLLLWKNEIFNALGDDGVRSSLSKEDLLNLPLPVPPYSDQIRIADYLDGVSAEIRSLGVSIQEQIETLEKYRCAVITEKVTGGLDANVPMKDSGVEWIGRMPEGWSLIRGRYLFAQRNERGNSENLQLLSPTQKFGVIPQTLYEELSGLRAVKLNEKADLTLFKTVHKGDYCISLRSFQGGFEYSEYEGVVSPAYQVFYPTSDICDGYYKYLFKETGFIEKMNSYTMTLRDGKNIAFADFGNTRIPVPPLDEQRRIAEYLDRKCHDIDAVISDKRAQIAALAEYERSVLFEYVTGKRQVV